MRKRFKYYIVYFYEKEKQTGQGACSRCYNKKIRSFKDMIDISKEIADTYKFDEVFITNFKLLNK